MAHKSGYSKATPPMKPKAEKPKAKKAGYQKSKKMPSGGDKAQKGYD